MLLGYDGTAIAYRIWYALPMHLRKKALVWSKAQVVQEIGGLFAHMYANTLLDVFKRVDRVSTNFCEAFVFWDAASAKEPRLKVFPEYKGQRGKTETDRQTKQVVYCLIDDIRTSLQQVNPRYAILLNKAEADDGLAALVTVGHAADSPVVMASRDFDMYQLLRDPIPRSAHFVWSYDLQDHDFVRAKDFVERWGFGPQYAPLYKAMVGDASDNWKGVPKVGEVTAKKFLQTCHEEQLPFESAQTRCEKLYGDVITTGVELTKLPSDLIETEDLEDLILDCWTAHAGPSDWKNFCKHYAFRELSAKDFDGRL